MMGRVLITGGKGYVGSRVADALSSAGHHIRLTTRQGSLASPEWLPAAEVVSLDLSSEESSDSACADINAIIHLASPNEIDSAALPLEAADATNTGTLRLVQSAIRAGVERFIYFSTAHIYGVPLAGNISEQTLPRPIHPYAITHRGAEDWVLAAHSQKKFCGIVLRLSNSFGGPLNPDLNRWTLVVNDLCRQAVSEGKLVLSSPGTQWRDFITLTDVGEAVLHLLNLPCEQCGDGVFNLGGDNSLRIVDMAERIQNRCSAILGFKPPLLRPESQLGQEVPKLDFRIDKLKETGFKLRGNIDEEIDATLKFCQKQTGKNTLS